VCVRPKGCRGRRRGGSPEKIASIVHNHLPHLIVNRPLKALIILVSQGLFANTNRRFAILQGGQTSGTFEADKTARQQKIVARLAGSPLQTRP